ncbi:MAG: hypothetical protein RI973_1498 [Bacteroidota bacterium]
MLKKTLNNNQLLDMNKYIFCSLLMTLAFAANLSAQNDLPSEQVEVVKIFEAQLAESEKVTVDPVLPEVDTAAKKQVYKIPAKSFSIEYPAPRIRPLTFKPDQEIAEAYKFYSKLGGGVPASVYGEGAFNTSIPRGEKESLDVGLNLLHHSANFSDDEVENQSFGLTKASGQGTYYFSQGYAVSANMGYTANRVNYYGYNLDPLYKRGPQESEAVRQRFGIFDLGASIFNGVETAGDFNYKAGIDFYAMGDDFAARETGFVVNAEATKWINKKHSFDLGLVTDFTWYDDTLSRAEALHNYTLHPAFTYHGNAFKFKAGGRIVSHDDEFLFFPDLEFALNLSGKALSLLLGLDGNLQKNTLRSLSTYNPYIHTRLSDGSIRNTSYFDAFAGVRGNFKFLEYSVRVGYKPTNDLALYYARVVDAGNDPVPADYTFDVIYDDINVINISGYVKANPLKNLSLTATVSQNIFDKVNEFKAWHLPVFQANLLAQYHGADNKFKARLQLFLENGVFSNTRGGSNVNRWDRLDPLYDLSVGGEYWFSKNFGAFIDANNLLNNKRERWLFYPTYGINLLGGITARF